MKTDRWLELFKSADPVLIRDCFCLQACNLLLKAKILFLQLRELKNLLHIRFLEWRRDVVLGFHILFF